MNAGKFGAALAEKQRGSGRIVECQDGKKGRAYNADPDCRGKLIVYMDDGGKRLCSPKNVKITGYFD